MMGLAGLKKDIERIRADTNQSLLELRGLLGKWDLGNFPELGGGAWWSRYRAQILGSDSQCNLCEWFLPNPR